MSDLRPLALLYLKSGLSVVPIPRHMMWTDPENKSSFHYTWKHLQAEPMREATCAREFASAVGMGVVCGAVSGGLTVIDFDVPGLYHLWREDIDAVDETLGQSLVVEVTPKAGHHVYFRSAAAIRNCKLAVRGEGPERKTMIETRGEGGLIFCAPTHGYQIIQGNMIHLPTIGVEDAQILLGCARAYNEVREVTPCDRPRKPSECTGTRPGDLFNDNTTWEEVIPMLGAKVCGRRGERLMITRPGKTGGVSATTGNGLRAQDYLYVFSSNWHPLEPETCYSRFAAWAMVVHGGDFAKAAKAANKLYGHKRTYTVNIPNAD